MSLLDDHAVVLITGISASGKSTVAQLLAERFSRGVHVRGDVFRRMVVAGRADMTGEPTDEAWRQLGLRYTLGAATADRYFEAGFSVVLQDVVLGAVLPTYVDAITSRPRYVVVLCPRVDVVTAREAGRAKRAYGPGMLDADALDRSLRAETPRLGLWLDSSDLTPAQTVDAIVSRANEALVDDAELARFYDAATRRGLTLDAIRAAARLEFPVADIETMLDEIKRGSAKDTP